jgi:3-dehydroquinate dehydratase
MRYVMKRSQIVAVLGEGAADDLKAASGADMIELRLDLSTEPIQTIKAIRQKSRSSPPIASRQREEGFWDLRERGSSCSFGPLSTPIWWISSFRQS